MTTLITTIAFMFISFIVAVLLIEWRCEQEAKGAYNQATKRERLRPPPRKNRPLQLSRCCDNGGDVNIEEHYHIYRKKRFLDI